MSAVSLVEVLYSFKGYLMLPKHSKITFDRISRHFRSIRNFFLKDQHTTFYIYFFFHKMATFGLIG